MTMPPDITTSNSGAVEQAAMPIAAAISDPKEKTPRTI
jgi:hypothetical protein